MTYPRLTSALLTIAVAAVCTGCIGQRNAVKTQAELRSATTNANAFAITLQKAMEADLQAHLKTRATLQSVVAEWKDRRIALARQPIIDARAAALMSLQTNFSFSLQTWQAARRAENQKLKDTFSTRLAPLESDVNSQAAVWAEAAKKAHDFPNDVGLALADAEARVAYLSAAGA